MIKKFILLLSSVLIVLNANSQSVTGRGDIFGTVKDSVSGEGLPYASILVVNLDDSTLNKGSMTDFNGSYNIKDLSSGKYEVAASYMGFKIKKTEVILQSKRQKLDFQLTSERYNLDEIEISAEKELLEKNIEKTVVNVSKNTTVSGGTALDVMKSIPSVDVDIDGNVNYRGSEKVVILINGEKSELVKSLDQVSSDQIERIEIINNPSAKYDAEGMSGIINIVMKSGIKGKKKTTLLLKAGYPETFGGSAGYSGSSGKTSYFVNVGADHNTKFQTKEHLRENYENPVGLNYYQYDRQDENQNTVFIHTGGNVKVRKKHQAGFSLYGTKKMNSANRWITYETREKNMSACNESNKDILIGFDNYSLDGKLSYSYKVNEKGSRINVKGHYSVLNQDQDMANTFYPEVSCQYPELQNTLAEQFNKNGDISISCHLPLNDSLLIETGYQGNLSDVTNNFFSDSYNYFTQIREADTALENRFNYIQMIHAGYIDLSKQIKKVDLSAGLRAEYTETNQNSANNENYLSIFPSLTVSGKLNAHYNIYSSLNRRINRPNVNMVNPYSSEYADLLNMHKGNPDLKPEYVNSAEAGTRFVFKNLSGIGSVYFRDILQAVSRVKSAYNDSALMVSFVNLDRAQLAGAEISASYKPFEWWTINASCNVFYTRLCGSYGTNHVDNSKSAWNGNISNQIKLLRKLNLQFSWYYRSKLPSVMGIYQERYYMDAGLSRNVLKNKGKLIFRVSDLFNTYWFGLDLNARDENGYRYSQTNRRKNESRYLILSFIFNIEGKEQEKKNSKESFFLDSFEK
ncbi:MAG: TonB-dependent receptor family protein [Bacteroidetes bacterium]|nr:TonB-dependent receptor family protein [Bacteroidota bacterium]MBU1719069.1 TonB-dependent receptor family protein [Bacteroidota bacterium]